MFYFHTLKVYNKINSIVTKDYLRTYIDLYLVDIYKGSGLVTKACCFS